MSSDSADLRIRKRGRFRKASVDSVDLSRIEVVGQVRQ
jgi:hypothetical protein